MATQHSFDWTTSNLDDVQDRARNRPRRQHEVGGMLGCVAQRGNAITGGTVALFAAAQAGLSPRQGPWVACCTSHGVFQGWTTRREGEAMISQPDSWCPACKRAKAHHDLEVRTTAHLQAVAESYERLEQRVSHQGWAQRLARLMNW
jgi:hypothetical protein